MSERSKTDPIKDPITLWRDFLGQAEQNLNDHLNRFMGREEYTAANQQLMQNFLKARGAFQEASRTYFEAINLPTRDDIQKINDRLGAAELQLDRIEESIARIAENGAQVTKPKAARKATAKSAATRPKRTRKPSKPEK